MDTSTTTSSIAGLVITELIKSGVSGFLILFMFVTFKRAATFAETRVNWLSDQLAKYMDDGREITKGAASAGIQRASQWTPLPSRNNQGFAE